MAMEAILSFVQVLLAIIPGIPYCIGYLEFLDLKKLAQEELGEDFTPLAFHTFL